MQPPPLGALGGAGAGCFTAAAADTGDPDLVHGAAGGDRAAFARLVESHWSRLVRIARSIVGEADAEDAVQDALVIAWRKLAGLRDRRAFRTWLTRVVVRTCLRRARRARRRDPELPLAEAAGLAAPASGGGAALDVRRALAHLAPRQRAVMHLTVVEGLSDSEIGRLLGITAGSVRAHRRRARNRLDRLWNDDPRGDDRR